MKQIVCEMCGSTELKKEDGEYICQACGTKYSVEEAKKLMVEIEGKVDVSGSSVKIDNVSEIADAINEKGSRDAKAKVRVGFILCAIAEIFLLAFGPVFYLFHTGTEEDFSTMFTSEILAYICIAVFIVLFIVTLFFIINPNKLNFILFMLFIVVYLADIILSGFITRWILLMFILLLLWLPLISKNYQKIK